MMMTNSHQTDKTNQKDETDQKTILVGVTDIFFYTKVRDALMSKGTRSNGFVRSRTSGKRPRQRLPPHSFWT